MTAHDAYREWFNDFLSTEYFAKYHDMTLEKARQLIREGREIEEQIEKLKQQHSENENKKRWRNTLWVQCQIFGDIRKWHMGMALSLLKIIPSTFE